MPKKTIKLKFLIIIAIMMIISPKAVTQEPALDKEVIVPKISFYKVDLVNAMQQLASKAGYNLVATPDVQGIITINLTDVTYDQALKVIVQSQGYVYEQEGKYFYVRKPEQAVTDQNNIAFIPVYYSDPKLLVELLMKSLGPNERIFNDDRARVIVVTGSKS